MKPDYVPFDAVADFSLSSFRRYLLASGWRLRKLRSSYSDERPQPDLFTRVEPSGVTLLLPLPHTPHSVDYRERLRDALQTLVDAEGKTVEKIIAAIHQVGYDVMRSAVPTELVKDESIRLASAKAYVAGMRELLASSATAEVNRLPFFLRRQKESFLFADSCRFGHTYRGSFGFVLESPLPPASTEPLFQDDPVVPFERRVIQRIARGIARVDEAVQADSTSPLVEGYREGLNANGCEDLAALVTGVSPAGMLFTFQLSPEWKTAAEADGARFEIGPPHIEVCEAAAKELRRNDVAIPARVAGLVVRLQNETDPTDLDERTGARNWPHCRRHTGRCKS